MSSMGFGGGVVTIGLTDPSDNCKLALYETRLSFSKRLMDFHIPGRNGGRNGW
jgi:hypothetical protein